MKSTSHADNMIPLVGTQAKRKNTSPIEFDWEKEVRSLMLDFRVPLVVRNTICDEVEREAKITDSSSVLYERARRRALEYVFA